MYTIKLLCQKANISQQTFYRLSSKNPEFKAIVSANKVKKGNGYRYTEDVLQWLLDYKGEDLPETKQETQDVPSAPSFDSAEIEELKKRIEELEARNQTLLSDLDTKERERQELLSQNGRLLWLLGQEKAEKMALLPQPKQPLLDRLKDILQRKERA